MRKAVVTAAVTAGALAFVPAAFGHAALSPPVAKSKVLQQFTLSVPTEEEGATTASVELTLPSGFAIDSFEPSPGWKRVAHGQTVKWSGGNVPTDEDAVFRFDASLDSSRRYTFDVRQTYSDGKVVEWNGPKGSDTPAPLVDGVSSLSGGGATTLSIVALIVGAAAHVRRVGVLALVATAALAMPAAAWAHAALLRTEPVASRTINTAPPAVRLTYTEPVEPRFAIVSVTDAAGRQLTSGSPERAPGSPQTLVTRLHHTPQGWYLVFWRVISADGHPVRGAFTFAVGPIPGPPPQFRVPSLSETAHTPQLLIGRWVVFISMLSALGLFVLRMVIARPVGRSLRGVTITFGVALAAALVATPIYVLLATAQFSLRSVFDLGAIVPVARASSFGRDYLDLEVVLALFAVAAGIALFVDRPERPQRSVVELLSLWAALGAGAAALVLPGLAGHEGQRSPRGLALPLDA